MSSETPASNLFASLRRLFGTALEMAQVRLELLGTDVELQIRRLFDSLLLAVIALQVLAVGLLLLCGFLMLLVSDAYRLAVLGVMTLLFLVAGLALLYSARQRLRNPNGMFGASVTELARDRAGLQAVDQHGPR